MKWIMGFIAGGAAATIQGGSVLTRLTSSKFTAGTGNHVLATGENVAAFGTSSLALFIPIIIAVLFIGLFILSFRKLRLMDKEKEIEKRGKRRKMIQKT